MSVESGEAAELYVPCPFCDADMDRLENGDYSCSRGDGYVMADDLDWWLTHTSMHPYYRWLERNVHHPAKREV